MMLLNPEKLDTAARWVVSLQARGATFRIRNNRLWLLPEKIYKTLSDEERATKRHCLAEIKAIVRDGLPDVALTPPAPPTPAVPELVRVRVEPTPEVYLRGTRVTEEDVRYAMRCMGDEVLADYDAGRITKFEAYQMARRGMRQLLNVRNGRKV